jgi:anti-anti-sigma regulatory factor
MSFPDERDPLDDPEEAATIAALMDDVALLDIDDPSSVGDWDVLQAPDVIDGIDSLVELCHAASIDRDLIIDLGRTTLLTASGARALYDIHLGKERRGQMLLLQSPSPLVAQVMEIVGLDHMVAVLTPASA